MNLLTPSRAADSTRAPNTISHRPWMMVLIVVVGSLTVFGCSRGAAKAPSSVPHLVRVVEIESAGAGAYEARHYTGVVRARTESNLGFRVAGKVAERLVNAGESVKNGQPLLRLDAVDFQLALQSAHAGVEAARALQIQTSLERERVRGLVEQRAEARDLLEKADAAADSSAAQLRSAEARAEQAANQAAYTTLYADADGVVMTTLAEPGQVVTAGQAVVVLAKDGRREAAVDIPESSLERIRQHEATAQLYLSPAVVVPATLRELSGVADPVARTFQARYVLEGDPSHFPLGATVTVRVSMSRDSAQPATEIPLGSLIDRGEGAAVWVVDPKTSTLQKRAVSVMKLGAESALIGQGLQPGDLVVSLGVQLLNAGQVVRIMKPSGKELR
jgi:RND family efflux transporter MFP subunit